MDPSKMTHQDASAGGAPVDADILSALKGHSMTNLLRFYARLTDVVSVARGVFVEKGELTKARGSKSMSSKPKGKRQQKKN